jgi:hypothetical protein
MKFHFNLTEQTLKIKSGEDWLVLPEEAKFFTLYGGLGFRLGDYNHWINFTLTQEKVCCFYKVPTDDNFLYYRRELTRPLGGVIEFEFTEYDRIEKRNGAWIPKHGT